MPDNRKLDNIATDEINELHYQKIKLSHGQDGSTTDVSFFSGKALPVRLGDSTSMDSFARLRTSEAKTLFDSQLQYDLQPLLWNTSLSGSASVAHLTGQSAAELTVTTNTSDQVIRQTKKYHRYQPGKSQFMLNTLVLGAAVEGVVKRVGNFDADNGVFIEQDGDGVISFVIRSKTGEIVEENRTNQTGWNNDKFDGSGTSAQTLDATKAQLVFTDLEWLGVGRVRFGFFMEGHILVGHEVHHGNKIDHVYMTTANLPARYEITVTGSPTTSATLIQSCSSVIAEGGIERQRGFPFAVTTDFPEISVSTAETPVLAIRPKATFVGQTTRAEVIMDSVSLYARTNETLFKVYYDGDFFAGQSWTSVHDASTVEYNVAGTGVVPGQLIDALVVPAGGNNTPASDGMGDMGRLPFTVDITGGNPNVILVTAKSRTSTSSVTVSMKWKEMR